MRGTGGFMNYKDENVLASIITIVEDAENQNRIRKHEVDYEITFGDQKRYVTTLLSKKYPESWDTMTIVNLKISNKIVRKLSRCYYH